MPFPSPASGYQGEVKRSGPSKRGKRDSFLKPSGSRSLTKSSSGGGGGDRSRREEPRQAGSGTGLAKAPSSSKGGRRANDGVGKNLKRI